MQKRKWQPTDDLLRDEQPSKKVKSSHQHQRQLSNFPPEVYDRLPKIWLTPRALRELDRRNRDRFPRPLAAQEQPIEKVAHAVGKPSLGLSKFARHGGPNLCDLRGVRLFYRFLNLLLLSTNEPPQCLDPTGGAWTMASSSTPVPGSNPEASESGHSSAYDINFLQVCMDHSIYYCNAKLHDGSWAPEPANLDEIRRAVKSEEFPLPPEGGFTHCLRSRYSMSKGTVMREVVPLLTPKIPNILRDGGILFTNLASLTRGETVIPKPDYYEGVHLETVDKTIRDELSDIIVPTMSAMVVAPNFFLEAKGPTGTQMVCDGQAMLDGAHGARLMHELKNYGMVRPIYDGNAYAFSATVVDIVLCLYAHHVVAPDAPGGEPKYFMTSVAAYFLRSEDYPKAVRALGNLRVRAQKVRDQFIEVANERARGGRLEATDLEEEEEVTVCHPPGVVDDVATSFTTSYLTVDGRDDQRRPKVPRSPPSPSSPQPKKRGRVYK
ncbi:hypothetical protein F4680DRAFT_472028 [Xylaria scruposa]|nr:hypothetical protein F4680DRAFT_472028 [Xylaria scruposa]